MKLLSFIFLFLITSSSVFANNKWYVPSEKSALKHTGIVGKKIIEKEFVNILIWNAHKEGFDLPWQEEFNEMLK